jgi:hypothetical protein
MRLLISHPELATELVSALNEADCLAARTDRDTVEVFMPWLSDTEDAAQATMELMFFIRAWASERQDFQATLLGPR